MTLVRAGAVVTATDLTPEMLTAAEGFIRGQEDGAALKLEFLPAKAEALPFEDASFDTATCRIAAHHFADPGRFVQEVRRVLRPGGTFVLIDNIAPADSELAFAMNKIEGDRDPSHVEAYSVARWMDWVAAAGLEPFFLSRWHRVKNYADWVQVSQTPAEVVGELERYVLSLPQRVREYLQVVEQDGKLVNLSHEVLLLASRKL